MYHIYSTICTSTIYNNIFLILPCLGEKALNCSLYVGNIIIHYCNDADSCHAFCCGVIITTHKDTQNTSIFPNRKDKT